MKRFFLLVFSLYFGIANSQEIQQSQTHTMGSLGNDQQDTVSIAVLLYNHVELQDFAGPMEVFSKAKGLTKGKYKIFTVGLTDKRIEVDEDLLHVEADYTADDFPKADYLVIPGANMTAINNLRKDKNVMRSIQKWNDDKNMKLLSVCTGAYLLAEAGILNDKRATTHFFVADDFQEQFPSIKLVKDVRFIDEGKILTASGVTSGIDLALYIVKQHSGEYIHDMISRAIQYNTDKSEKWPVAPNGMKYRSKN